MLIKVITNRSGLFWRSSQHDIADIRVTIETIHWLTVIMITVERAKLNYHVMFNKNHLIDKNEFFYYSVT